MVTSSRRDGVLAPVRQGLRVERVSVSFGGVTALSDVSLVAHPGSVLGLIGPSGSGKTTVLNTICGFVRAHSGRVLWEGRNLNRIRPHQLARLGICRTVQNIGLFAGMTVLDNVLVGADPIARAGFFSHLLGFSRAYRDESQLTGRAYRLMEELGISNLAERRAGDLPYSLQKRVSLARALISAPRLLMLDELASDLSAGEQAELGDLIRRLRSRHTTVLLVEHHLEFVMNVCDQVVVLNAGQMIASGPPHQVRESATVMAAYLGTPTAQRNSSRI